jgi:HEAT repeat protein
VSRTRMKQVHGTIEPSRPRPSSGRQRSSWYICATAGLISLQIMGCQDSFGLRSDPASLPSGVPATQAVQVLDAGLSDPDPRVRSSAIEVIVQTRQSRLMPKVKRSIRDPIVPVRFSALVAMGELRYSLAKRDMHQIFNEENENPSVRLAAAYALDRLGEKQYANHYYDAITSTDMTLRANSALLLGRSGDRNTLKLLYWALQDRDSDDKVLQQAIESVAILGDERIYQKLWTELISAYADDRIHGIRGMGHLGIEPAKQALGTMLEDPILEVRLAAAEQLGRFNDPVGQYLVQEAFKPDPKRDAAAQIRIKVMAAMAIGEIGTESLIQYLPRLLNDASPFVRIAAAKAALRQRM